MRQTCICCSHTKLTLASSVPLVVFIPLKKQSHLPLHKALTLSMILGFEELYIHSSPVVSGLVRLWLGMTSSTVSVVVSGEGRARS